MVERSGVGQIKIILLRKCMESIILKKKTIEAKNTG